MKTLSVLFLAFTSLILVDKIQEKETVKAVFDGYEDETYYFTAMDSTSYEFQKIKPEALQKYNLKDIKFKGKNFDVIYIIETELDENEEENSEYVILDLKLNN